MKLFAALFVSIVLIAVLTFAMPLLVRISDAIEDAGERFWKRWIP